MVGFQGITHARLAPDTTRTVLVAPLVCLALAILALVNLRSKPRHSVALVIGALLLFGTVVGLRSVRLIRTHPEVMNKQVEAKTQAFWPPLYSD